MVRRKKKRSAASVAQDLEEAGFKDSLRMLERLRSMPHQRRPWTQVEDELVIEAPIADADLAIIMGRTTTSISNRRLRLKKKAEANGN